jgi:hypothetical protein
MVIIPIIMLVTLHGPGGQEIDINPHEVSSIREPSAGTEGHFPKGVHCLITMTNGKTNAVVDDCDAVRMLLEKDKQ